MSDKVVLSIGTWSSKCVACGRSVDPMSKSHDTIVGYGPDNGKPGCGKTFTHVMSDYIGAGIEESVRIMRPDLEYVG